MKKYSAVCLCLVLLGNVTTVANAENVSTSNISSTEGAIKNSGDAHIRVLPMLSQPSIKNGQRVLVSAIIETTQGIKSVVADMGGVEKIVLHPDLSKGGTDASGHRGIYSAEWIGHDLEEKIYTMSITVVDNEGHAYTDRSLEFSDPIAGLNTPGIPVYPQGGLQHVFGTPGYIIATETAPNTGVINAAGAVVFNSNSGGTAVLIKYAENAPAAVATHQAQSILNAFAQINCSVYDPVTDSALFATNASPSVIVKVTLGGSTGQVAVDGYLTLNSGENNVLSGAWDPGTSTALFCGTGPNTVVKVGLGSPSGSPVRIGALSIPDAGSIRSTLIVGNGEALLGLDTTPATVIKVTIGAANAAPTRVAGALTFNLNENGNAGFPGGFEPSQNEALFGLGTNPTTIVKVDAGAQGVLPTRVGAVVFNGGASENGIGPMVYDPVNKLALVQSGQSFFIKVGIGAQGAVPVRGGSVSTAGNGAFYTAGVIDTANNVGLFAFGAPPFSVHKIALNGALATNPTSVGVGTGVNGETAPQSAVFDPATGLALIGANSQAGVSVIKVSMNGTQGPPTRIGAVTVSGSALLSAVYDSVQQEALFAGTANQVHKIAMNAPAAAPTLVGTVPTNINVEDSFTCAVYSASQKEALFGTHRPPGSVTKISMNAVGAAPTKVGTVAFNAGEDNPLSMVLDDATNVALIGTHTSPGIVVKVALGSVGTPPTRLSALTLNAGEQNLDCATFDAANSVALFGSTGASVGSIIKVAVNGSTNAPPLRVSAVALNSGENGLVSAVFDPVNRVALFSNDIGGGISSAFKVDPGTAAAAPVRLGAITFQPGEIGMNAAVIDPANGLAYFISHGGVTDFTPIITVSYTQRFLTYGTKFTMPEQGIVTDVRFFSHVADGNVKLGIMNPPGTILWQSGSLANLASGEVVATIASGSPSSLTLSPGTYYLAYITDSLKAVPSFTPGIAGDGFASTGPQSLTLSTNTPFVINSDKYTEYITYTAVASPITISAGASATPNPATVGQSVALSVTASGPNTPLTYSWNFGDGSATASGSTVNHTFASAGLFTAKVTITDALSNTNSSQVIVTVNALTALALSSTPTATPNPAGPGQSVTFTASASGGSGALIYSWSFGDGTAAVIGVTVTHTYRVAGTFTAHVTATDASSATVGADVAVKIVAPLVGEGLDSDGDGFSDSFEIAAGTNPNDPASTPTGKPASTPLPVTVAHLKIGLNFSSKKSSADTITATGLLPFSTGFKVTGQKVIFDIGGVLHAFTLSSKGTGSDGKNAFKITFNTKASNVSHSGLFTVKLSGSFAETLASVGLPNTTTKGTAVMVPVSIVFDGASYQAIKNLKYTAKKGVSGKAQ